MPDDTRPAAPRALHLCPTCDSGLIDLVDGDEVTPGLWELSVRCADCETTHALCCGGDDLAKLERELCRATAELERELERFARLRFEEDIARFARALEADAIMPMDFGVAR
jgi:hypothetical protein